MSSSATGESAFSNRHRALGTGHRAQSSGLGKENIKSHIFVPLHKMPAMRYPDLKNDLTFRKIFGKHKH